MQGNMAQTEQFNQLKSLSFFMDFTNVELWEVFRDLIGFKEYRPV
jgi:hypothetical protein